MTKYKKKVKNKKTDPLKLNARVAHYSPVFPKLESVNLCSGEFLFGSKRQGVESTRIFLLLKLACWINVVFA